MEVNSHVTHKAYYGYCQEDVTDRQSFYRAALVHISRRMTHLPGTNAMDVIFTSYISARISYMLLIDRPRPASGCKYRP